MGTLRLPDSSCVPLRAHHLLGRSRSMHSALPLPDVSAQHLCIAWDGQRWRARDLASRNGTLLDGVRLGSGEDAPLARGAVLELGNPSARVELVDDGPPTVLAFGPHGPLAGDPDILALPSADDPALVILRDPDEGWIASSDDHRAPVEDGQQVEAGGAVWTLSLPEALAGTEDVRAATAAPSGLGLELRVSADEEYIEVQVALGERRVSLEPRAHHAVLLVLARNRLDDADEPEAEQGWTYRDVLRKQVQMSANQLYVSVYRLRLEFEALGVNTPIIEQRKTTHQVRLGLRQVQVRALGEVVAAP